MSETTIIETFKRFRAADFARDPEALATLDASDAVARPQGVTGREAGKLLDTSINIAFPDYVGE